MKKLRVAILFGGRSAEHQISLLSAKNVVNSIDRDLFEPILIGISKEGVWHINGDSLKLLNPDDPKQIQLGELGEEVVLSHNDQSIIGIDASESIGSVDVVYPVLHGTYGEDGSVQGLAKLAGLPCVGCGILGSAIGMDKDIMKKILRDGGIGIADFFTFRKGSNRNPSYEEVVDRLGHELFVKPANLGSSVGVSFATTKEEFEKALEEGFKYDRKVIVEEKVKGREIEVAVMGNDEPIASVPGEIMPKSGWYSFENKYVDEDGAALGIPADLDESTTKRMMEAAVETYILLELSGLTRVDFFLKEDGSLIVNEVNTLPGFTSISMYPKLWEYSGISQRELITKLIHYALERHEQEMALAR
ncbi:D-alanine--D-alanine ligase [Portibacter marinus]|uniref:D-alanine--D-alanine ligase n=1 Tax=Portibacter marinus TaxID=2898660 RepID=UPI001F2B42CB|nr:D-alanine--D-alanine ligase [Portibacter marinus]